jgi:DNA repair protein RadC
VISEAIDMSICYSTCSLGLNKSVLFFEVFREAVSQRATAIPVVHNHPSGNFEPNIEDNPLSAVMTIRNFE